ncbi:Flavin monooxygenase-like [Trinorchestia longiramus]|nr:Flavin monooxygenase-like [Trinorchestia longiramus]
MKTVGIIGAGAAGLCALRHVLASSNMVPVIWEQSNCVGGTWVYTDQLGKDENGLPVHSSMYKNLRTNLPKEVMSFPDFPFPAEGTSFIHHTDVLKYLQDYTQHFDLEPHIKFEHVVQEVKPSRPGEQDTDWLVTVRDLKTDTVSTTLCDALFVCNGHYSVPYVPVLEGIDEFKGSVLHSHSYRDPSDYAGKTVVVLGASSSGIDISIELSAVAQKVYLCHNLPIPLPAKMPPNLEQASGIVGVKEGSGDTFVLKDGTEVVADAILYCTGYYYVFPFLSPSCGVTVKDNQVWPLYRHLIHCDYPTMAFVGIPSKICPFPFFDIQIRYFLRTFSGAAPLPSPEAMRADAEDYLQRRLQQGAAPRHYHLLGSMQWPYISELADSAGLPHLPHGTQQLYELVHGIRKRDLIDYKNKSFTLARDGTYIEQ